MRQLGMVCRAAAYSMSTVQFDKTAETWTNVTNVFGAQSAAYCMRPQIPFR